MLLVLVSDSVLFSISMCLDTIYLGLVGCPPFGKELLIQSNICSLCIMFIRKFSFFPNFVSRAGLWL